MGTLRLDQSTFLGGLDGLDPHTGVVYLFTSNAALTDLDPAFRRPGRIDLVMHFARPDAELRRRLIAGHWHPLALAAMDLELAVTLTEGFSFAEIDELKKLLVLHYLERGKFDWSAAWHDYRHGRGEDETRSRIGFHRCSMPSAP